jgi:hypothetical protein
MPKRCLTTPRSSGDGLWNRQHLRIARAAAGTEIVSGDVKPGDLVITAEQAEAANKAASPRLAF